MTQRYHYLPCKKCGILHLEAKFGYSGRMCQDCRKKQNKKTWSLRKNPLKYHTADEYAQGVLNSINSEKRKDIY